MRVENDDEVGCRNFAFEQSTAVARCIDMMTFFLVTVYERSYLELEADEDHLYGLPHLRP